MYCINLNHNKKKRVPYLAHEKADSNKCVSMTLPLFHSCVFCNAPWAYSTPSKPLPGPAVHRSNWQAAQMKGKCLPTSDPDVGQLPDGAAGLSMWNPFETSGSHVY